MLNMENERKHASYTQDGMQNARHRFFKNIYINLFILIGG